MFDKNTKGGSPHDRKEQQPQMKAGEQCSSSTKRLAPINTNIGRGSNVPSQSINTASSSEYSPSVNTGSSVPFTPATSPYSPSIWSAGIGTPMSAAGHTQSATLQTKPYLETSSAQSGNPKAKSATPSSLSAHGAGVTQTNAPAATQYHLLRGEPGKEYTITFYDENDVRVNHAFPLTRNPSGRFLDANGRPCTLPKKAWVLPLKSSHAAATVNNAAAAQTNVSTETGDANETPRVFTGPLQRNENSTNPRIKVVDTSVMSELSAHYLQTLPHMASITHPVYEQEANGGNFNIQLSRDHAPFQEAFPGAMQMARTSNPSHLQVRWGARVVCIKTEFVENIHWSIKRGIWVAMDKVGERVTRLWDECHPRGDPVILLFSVNGQKSYCGLALMQGPWKEGGGAPGWQDREDDSKQMGKIPVQWTYIKNISFEYFKDIIHTHNGQPIVNMWNGMHFPWEKGHEVVKIYIDKAHFTNVICWRGDRPYNPYKEVTHPGQLDPRLRTRPNDMTIMKRRIAARDMIEGGHVAKDETAVINRPAYHQTPRRGGYGATSGGWRQQSQQVWDTDPTPTGQNRYGALDGNMTTTPPNFDGSTSPSPQPGDMVSYIVDKHGNYVPVTPTHRPAGRLQIPGAIPGRLPYQQTFQSYAQELCATQQDPFNNMPSRGPYHETPRQGRGGHRGAAPRLRGTHSFINTANVRMNEPGTGYGTQNPVNADSFHGHVMGQIQQPTAAPMSPTVQRIRSEEGINQQPEMLANSQGASSISNIAPHVLGAQSPRHSSEVLRKAVSKHNLFVPKGAASPQLQSTGFNPSSPEIGDVSAGDTHGSVPAVEDTPSHPPGTLHPADPKHFASRLKSLIEDSVYPTPADAESIEKEAHLENKLNNVNKIFIAMQGAVSRVCHEHEQIKKEKNIETGRTRKGDFDSPDFDADASSSQWDVYEIGSSTTFERRCVSPVRGSDGGILDSASKHDSPETKALRRKLNHLERYFYGQGSDSSMYGRMEADVDKLVNSPPESVANDKKDENDGEDGKDGKDEEDGKGDEYGADGAGGGVSLE